MGGALLLAVPVAIVAFLLGAPALLGLQRSVFVAQAIAVRGPLLIGAVLLLLLLLIAIAGSRGARRALWAAALVVAVFAAATGGLLATRGLGGERLPATHADDDLRVLTWNTRGDEPGSPTIAKLAIDVDADVVVLPETTESMGVEIANQMREAGRPMWVHTRTYDEEYKATATTLLIAPKLGDYVVVTDEGDTETLPSVIARPLGDGPTIIAAHAVAPRPDNMASWNRDLEWLASKCRGNTILAGDLNATVDHFAGLEEARTSEFHSVLGACADGALATGNGAAGTWTAGIPPLLGTQIDHVLATRGWSFSGFEIVTSVDTKGSDHRPVVAQLSPRT